MADIWMWLGVALGAIVAYEIVRALVARAIARRLRRRAFEFVRRHDVRLDEFKFMNKALVEAELMNDPDLTGRIVDAAAKEGKTVLEVRGEVSSWIDEIVPFFNLSSYFRLGQPIAGLALRSLYDVSIDQPSYERAHAKLPPGARLMYVMNHRSNADYVLVAYMLREKIALSYAVGEWARVFPLEWLFKSFGSYFIRRSFKNPLYHAVLEKYVQLISKRGVSQGVFPEGGLSRDGLLRSPKIGILGYAAGVAHDSEFARSFYFVPVGINYDRVLEDASLVGELTGRPPASLRIAQKLGRLVAFLVLLPWTLLSNLARYVAGRPKGHGLAAVSFGEPVSLAEFLSTAPGFATLPREERKPHLQRLADLLMDRIGAVVPIVPVALAARALVEAHATEVSYDRFVARVGALRVELAKKGARFAGGRRLREWEAGRARLEDEAETRNAELVDLDASLIGQAEAEATCEAALTVLGAHGLARKRGGVVHVAPEGRRLLHYYANSIAQHCGGPIEDADAPRARR